MRACSLRFSRTRSTILKINARAADQCRARPRPMEDKVAAHAGRALPLIPSATYMTQKVGRKIFRRSHACNRTDDNTYHRPGASTTPAHVVTFVFVPGACGRDILLEMCWLFSHSSTASAYRPAAMPYKACLCFNSRPRRGNRPQALDCSRDRIKVWA